MAWTPKPGFSGVMEDVVVPRVLAIIERDYKEALDYYFPDDDLLDFAERTLGKVRRKEFPLVAVGPTANLVVESEDSARHTQPLRVALYLMVTGPDDETVTTLVMQYVKVMHGVLHKATLADYFGDSASRVFGFSLDVEHFYTPVLSNETTFGRAANMILTLNFDSR
jgi:hypothetical protein